MTLGLLGEMDWDSCGGLTPRTWICVDAGYSREEVKAVLLGRGIGFVSEAVQSLEELAGRVAFQGKQNRILGALARQEILRSLLSERRIGAMLPELRRLRRQSVFFKKLDLAIQNARRAFAHAEEEEVYEERLRKQFGEDPRRSEVRSLVRAYEAWMEAAGFFDLPRVLREATQRLQEESRPPSAPSLSGVSVKLAGLPEKIVHLTVATAPESLEQAFWEALSRHVEVQRVGLAGRALSHGAGGGLADSDLTEGVPSSARTSGEDLASRKSILLWERWHTLDDAAESLGSLLREVGRGVILIPDHPAVRRSVVRALESAGIPLADPRDPMRLRMAEEVKWALLPLEVVASRFERRVVLAFLRQVCAESELAQAELEINSRGIVRGLSSYRSGKLENVYSRLEECNALFGSRTSLAELSQTHLSYLRRFCGEDSKFYGLVSFFEKFWQSFCEDASRFERESGRAPLLHYWERLQARLESETPPAMPLRAAEGVVLHRLGQAPLEPCENLWIFGLPPDWLSAAQVKDLWYSERDRSLLASEFAVYSSREERTNRIAVLQAWLQSARKCVFLDAQFDWDGRERESLAPLLREAGVSQSDGGALSLRVPEGSCGMVQLNSVVQQGAHLEPLEKGAHPRFEESFGVAWSRSPKQFRLPPLSAVGRSEIRATELDQYSRCAFRGLGFGRWKLFDLREPGLEAWAEVRGNLLHEAVKLLLLREKSAFLASNGGSIAGCNPERDSIRETLREALSKALRSVKLQGLRQGKKLAKMLEEDCLLVLEAFFEKEKEYASRSKTRVLSLEGPRLSIRYDDFSIVGVPDRIDEHADGVFILDYKTGSALAKGREMVDEGYRLQLPFYALAASQALQKQTLGVQFVELNRKAGRGQGIFFKKWNGKEEGALTNTRARLSVFEADPEAVWAKCAEQVQSHAQAYFEGRFEARPKKDSECRSCTLADLCGRNRFETHPTGAVHE